MRPFWQIAGALAFLVALALPTHAEEPKYPEFSAPVVDAAHVLTDEEKSAITRKLFDLQLNTGVQFAVATVPSLDGIEIEPYANGLFRNWKVGQKGVNNGLLLVLAPNERKLRFEVGYGLEGSFTDLQSKLILHNTMVPKLKAGDPAGALKAGVDDAIIVLTKDKANLPERLKPEDQQTTDLIIGLFVFFLIFLFIVAIVVAMFRAARKAGWGSGWSTGPYIGGAAGSSWGSSNDSSSGGSDSSSSGGDFSGGGGGDSGGGGSSDSY